MIPAAFTVAAAGYALLAVFDSGVGLAVAQGVAGVGFGAAFSPLLTLALSGVAIEDAADASGLLVTMNQVGQVVGVATFGTLFLSVAPPSGQALAVTSLALAGAVLVAAGAGLLLPRPTRP